jgi:hypothetical protein
MKSCLSHYLTNLMHKICFTISFILCRYMFRAHVLIIRRSKLHYTASGIITTIGRIVKQIFRGTSWLNSEINILRCTVSKTSKNEILCAFMRLSLAILLRLRNVSDKACKEKNTHFIFKNFFPKIVPIMR